MAKKKKTIDIDWDKVFRLRCQSKLGIQLTPEDIEYFSAAIKQDGERYSNMDKDVFNATVPFGSHARIE